MDRARLVKLLSENAYVLREDMTLMEQGALKVQAFGVDVTREQAARLRVNLKRLEEIIADFADAEA